MDASLLVDALSVDDARAVQLRSLLLGETLFAPAHVDIEFVSGLRKQLNAQAVSEERAEEALADLRDLRIRRVPHEPEISRIWELRNNLSAQDAAYVAIAEALDVPLVTTDARLARAPGPLCEIRLATSRDSS